MPEVIEQQTLIKTVAPEDIAVGDILVVTEVIGQFIPASLGDEFGGPPRPVLMPFKPRTAGEPVEVLSVCLPFLMVEDLNNYQESIDLRLTSVARVPRSYAKAARKRRKQREGKKKSKRPKPTPPHDGNYS